VPGVDSVCGSDVADPAIKNAANRKMPRSQLSLKRGPPASTFRGAAEKPKHLEFARDKARCVENQLGLSRFRQILRRAFHAPQKEG
jgi:hypothetical protein